MANNETMKAVRFHGKEDLRFEDIPVPKTGKGQVKIRPAWVGICGSGRQKHLNLHLHC
jgi:threonine dehydrogenase-like Zn-dependent dehydrogenase